ncbi:ring-cleaving dioxygenase [Halosimplex litoreum]|uniref:Ring-cleaving dioxygenase n=1 Tax=Halosimplex litoreum TaxID=1198301 RepID=A0A7T3FYH5_9EURY|nr:ring-cleaving dioxygenase [Halosimplex litoreum]QPV63094.1 ring-cleaving dioxygenase [Halosimplex litoreum]
MPADIPGIHHVTAVASDPGRTHRFCSETLGLRLVKRSVNQDDESVYHLFYGDRSGTPGTNMTYFPYPDAQLGRVGTGQVTTVQLQIPAGSVEYWTDRFESEGVDHEPPRERFGDRVIPFADPDGLPLELVADGDAAESDPPDGPVPDRHAIRGFFGVTLSLATARGTGSLLETMGFQPTRSENHRQRFRTSGDLGTVVDVLEDPEAPRGESGIGTVHHVAFQVSDAEQAQWHDALVERGLRPTQIIDRKWFESIYARTAGGVLFEFATVSPGYTVDEPVDELGERLVLPEWLEDRREAIEARLPDLSVTPRRA